MATTNGFVWPLGGLAVADEMNTAFGPRINRNRWDFHDGIDLPAKKGTPIHAMCAGLVHQAGPAGNGFRSRHVVVKVNDATAGTLYLVHVHLDSIDAGIQVGGPVLQGQVIGTVGDDGAAYPHLHLEVRQGSPAQTASVHPLGYLPYQDTTNFTEPVADRANDLTGRRAVRLRFHGVSRLEGDLVRVEVDLRRGSNVLATRVVDFNDKSTVNEGNEDQLMWVDDVAVEGYQKSNLKKDARVDLHYGVLVRELPDDCDILVARVIDVRANVVTSQPIAVPDRPSLDERLRFTTGTPPAWEFLVSASGVGTSATIRDGVGRHRSFGLLCRDRSDLETTPQRACIQRPLPAGRFQWIVESWIKLRELSLAPGQTVTLLSFMGPGGISAAARVRRTAGGYFARVSVRDGTGETRGVTTRARIKPKVWRRWRLGVYRLGTRESTAVLAISDGANGPSAVMEVGRIDWNSTEAEPQAVRVGIASSSAGATATVYADDVRVTERELVSAG